MEDFRAWALRHDWYLYKTLEFEATTDYAYMAPSGQRVIISHNTEDNTISIF